MRVTRNLWGYSDKHFNFICCTRKKDPAGINFGFLLPERLKNCILNEKLNPFFSIRVFFHGHWQLAGQQGKGGDHFLLNSTTSTCSPTFRHLFATLHVRWLWPIFNRTACIYQTATRWDFPAYRITIWLINDVMLIVICLPVDLNLGFVIVILHEKSVYSNSHQLSSLYYKQTN